MVSETHSIISGLKPALHFMSINMIPIFNLLYSTITEAISAIKMIDGSLQNGVGDKPEVKEQMEMLHKFLSDSKHLMYMSYFIQQFMICFNVFFIFL